MTPHRNAEYLRALADGKLVMVEYVDEPGERFPLWTCSTTVLLDLLHPYRETPQSRNWAFHIEHTEPPHDPF